MEPQAEADKASSSRETDKTRTKTASAGRKSGETNAEIRLVWMWGNVALHQDARKDKDKPRDGSAEKRGQDASGEALYLDNRGTNKAISYVYQRDPAEKMYLPGPLPPARVENDDMKIRRPGRFR